MAKTNFSIAVNEDNVGLSTTEWRIIQEIGYGVNKNCGQTFLVEGAVRCNYLSAVGEIKPTRSNAACVIWSVKQGETERDFSKEIQNEEIKRKHLHLGIGLPCCAPVRARVFIGETAATVLHIGVYAGSGWMVADDSQRSWIIAIQKFENPIPTFVV